MSEIHGRLLIGGMTLKDLYGVVELKDDCGCAQWCGHLLVDLQFHEHLESRRPYRLEMDDGRSGQVVITRVECPLGQRKLSVVFEGVSPLVTARPAATESRRRDEPIEVPG